MLEGLNALLDHRAEVYIPELAQTFACPPSFRIFAAQNPVQEGGGRRGLPKSFLNRFTRVHVESLCSQDLAFIAGEPAAAPEKAYTMCWRDCLAEWSELCRHSKYQVGMSGDALCSLGCASPDMATPR